ncbi:MAG: hypothetical protein MNPFHGCM_00326 [Gemmatimonadaceae bacterium]|nr:hypothetical protein [Gemmatimonadaceae bacterium]
MAADARLFARRYLPIVMAPLVIALGVGCAARAAGSTALPVVEVPQRHIRVAIAAEPGLVALTHDGEWHLTDLAGRDVLRPAKRDGWSVERRGRRLRAVHAEGRTSPWVDSALVLVLRQSEPNVVVNDHRYRGSLLYAATDSATLLVNVVAVESYLRGVVSLEIGARPPSDRAAVEAQAIVARSFAFERMNSYQRREYDLTSLDLDQVYGGIAAETVQGDAAIAATRNLVMSYAGHAIGAPYHAMCGGSTAAASDVWTSGGVPYLRSASDRIPGTASSYCEIAPRFDWNREFTAAALRDLAKVYLRRYATGSTSVPGNVLDVQVVARTAEGRVAALAVSSDGGVFRLTGNDIRHVLRGIGGDLLPSTYFSLDPVVSRDGKLTQLAVRGRGNGHGVGMCQWGAIGRARAGQDVRAILRAYFPVAELARGT